MKTILSIGVLGACILALPGCRSGYDVDVRNLSDQPIVASVITESNGGMYLLASARLGPGDRAGLGAQTASGSHVWVEADFGHNTGFPAKLDLVPGRTVVNVRDKGAGATGRPVMEQVQGP